MTLSRPSMSLLPPQIPAVARDWFARFEGAGLDGVVAKPPGLAYKEGERVMLKVKHERTADCVVGGFRWHKDGGGVGSLLLGLYDEDKALHHVGVASGFTVAHAQEPRRRLGPLPPGESRGPSLGGDDAARPMRLADPDHRAGGMPARTSPGRLSPPSSCARLPTTIFKATGSATPPPSAAGGQSARLPRAPTPSSKPQCPRSSPGSSKPGPRRAQAPASAAMRAERGSSRR